MPPRQIGEVSDGCALVRPSADPAAWRAAGASQPAQQDLPATVWLLSQSTAWRGSNLATIELLIQPALALGRYRIYCDAQRPVALALWSEREADEKAQTQPCWLLRLIAPFARRGSGVRRQVLADLASGPLRGQHYLLVADLPRPIAPGAGGRGWFGGGIPGDAFR